MRRASLALVFALSVAGCTGERLTKANVDEVQEGMSRKQVESILGPPTSVDNGQAVLLKRSVYLYKQSNGTVTILFRNDKVEAKSSTLQK